MDETYLKNLETAAHIIMVRLIEVALPFFLRVASGGGGGAKGQGKQRNTRGTLECVRGACVGWSAAAAAARRKENRYRVVLLPFSPFSPFCAKGKHFLCFDCVSFRPAIVFALCVVASSFRPQCGVEQHQRVVRSNNLTVLFLIHLSHFSLSLTHTRSLPFY